MDRIAFGVRTAGWSDRNPRHTTPGTRGMDYMLMLFLAGKGHFHDASGYRVLTGPLVGLIVTPGEPGVLMADGEDPYVHYYSRFYGATAQAMAREIVARRGGRFFASRHTEELAENIRRCARAQRTDLPREAWMGAREGWLALSLGMLLDETVAPQKDGELTASSLRDYLESRIAEPTDLGRFAGDFRMSRSAFCRKVRRVCGKTLQKMHEEIKMDWAKTLLALKRLPVREVARRVGYADPFYFSRVFKRATGRSPKAFRSP